MVGASERGRRTSFKLRKVTSDERRAKRKSGKLKSETLKRSLRGYAPASARIVFPGCRLLQRSIAEVLKHLGVERGKAKRPNVFTFGRCSLKVLLAEDAGVYRQITGYDLS